MRLRADILRFAALFTVYCVALGSVFLLAGGGIGRLLSDSAFVVPVISAMLASAGFGWRRKIVYSTLTLWLYLAPAYIADASGLIGAIGSPDAPMTALTSLGAALYLIWWTAFPLLMLMRFVGRTPTRMWSRTPD